MPAPTAPSNALTAAAVLAGAWGVVMLLLSVAAAIPAVAQGGNPAPMALPALLAVASLVSGHGIRRRRWPYLALGAAAAWIAFLALVPLKVSVPGILLNTVIMGLVLTNLRRFR